MTATTWGQSACGMYVMVSFLALLAGCAGRQESEYDFVQAFLKHPGRMTDYPQDDDTRQLLETFKPRLFISPDSYVPIDFYIDYLPNCAVRQKGARRKIIYRNVDRDILTDIQNDPERHLDFVPTVDQALSWAVEDVHPTFYGRIYRDTFTMDHRKIDLLFLKYSVVLPYSGLPKDIAGWKKLGSGLIGDRRGWHELDIHGAIHIVLEEQTQRPIGVILAQHNHHRVFLRDHDIVWPEDNRILVSLAELSNEPYLIGFDGDARYERVVGNPLEVEFLFSRTDKVPLTGGYDYVRTPETGAEEVKMDLELLPLDDPLYAASISLGDRRRILGLFESWYVAGPPGIDYYTLPDLKDLADLMAFWYINADDNRFFHLFRENVGSFPEVNLSPLLAYQKTMLYKVLSSLING